MEPPNAGIVSRAYGSEVEQMLNDPIPLNMFDLSQTPENDSWTMNRP
jgi:hypothetical protein